MKNILFVTIRKFQFELPDTAHSQRVKESHAS